MCRPRTKRGASQRSRACQERMDRPQTSLIFVSRIRPTSPSGHVLPTPPLVCSSSSPSSSPSLSPYKQPHPHVLSTLSLRLSSSLPPLSLSHTQVEIFQKSFKNFVERTQKFLCFRRIEEGANGRTPVCLLPFWSQFPDSIPEVCSQDIALSGLQKPL